MTTIISIKGKNERMGRLFKTPKHNLLYKGRPALEQTVEYMKRFGNVMVMTHENSPPDTSIVDMLLKMDLPDKFFVVDCDVIPIRLNEPIRDTVYCFKNTNGLIGYSNYSILDGDVIACNEKGDIFELAGSGIYYFEDSNKFKEKAFLCKHISDVIKNYDSPIKADTTSEIFRFGSLQTILNNEVGI